MRIPDLTSEKEVACAWSAIVEPGDVAAGVLREQMGSAAALEWLLTQPDVEKLSPQILFDEEGRERPWVKALKRWLPRVEDLDVQRDLDALARVEGTVLWPEHPAWPEGLNDLGLEAPAALWVRGELKAMPRVAIVGARASSSHGNSVARDVAFELARKGVCVVSGGAFGIDAAAHVGALKVGQTVAVMAGGVSYLYPASHAGLFEQIELSGAIVAECPPDWRPARWRFLSRNRLIAALSQASVVVEASARSGALVTIRRAREMGRPVGAFPGSVSSQMSAGCNEAIREGVTLVTGVDDILELMSGIGDFLFDMPEGKKPRLDADVQRIFDALPAKGSATVRWVARAAGLGVDEVEQGMTTLLLKKLVTCEGDAFARCR
ncbi:DNA-processing protein DprA [Actinomyces sp.]|nr:DNA-processing protein DprA [Actinomyces sp.]MDU5231816.1 DNA-processing protein DprA [Actinomyces sp.]